MGEAKKRRTNPGEEIVWHHTSVLRTNLMWMKGEIVPEGQEEPAIHPHLGKLYGNALTRRAMEDFPGLVWFTREMRVPNCLVVSEIQLVKPDGTSTTIPLERTASSAISMRRVALGFLPSRTPLIPWPKYYGYKTAEGRVLNETAREVGDDPDRWLVSELPVDILEVVDFRASKSLTDLKMQKVAPNYIDDIKRMVTACRETPGVFIPPSYLSEAECEMLARQYKLPIAGNASSIGRSKLLGK